MTAHASIMLLQTSKWCFNGHLQDLQAVRLTFHELRLMQTSHVTLAGLASETFAAAFGSEKNDTNSLLVRICNDRHELNFPFAMVIHSADELNPCPLSGVFYKCNLWELLG